MMHRGEENRNIGYFMDGKKQNTTMKGKDLGVVMCPDSSYTEQTRANKAARKANFILRSVVSSDADVNMKLFQTYVIPILSY